MISCESSAFLQLLWITDISRKNSNPTSSACAKSSPKIQWVDGRQILSALCKNSNEIISSTEKFLMFLLKIVQRSLIIYHLMASTRVQHQSCLLLFSSPDLLIPKAQLMDNSLDLWVKYNQYLESFVSPHYMTDHRAGPEKKMETMNGGRKLTKKDRWLTDREHTLSTGKMIQVKCNVGNSASAWGRVHEMTIYHSSHSLQKNYVSGPQ